MTTVWFEGFEEIETLMQPELTVKIPAPLVADEGQLLLTAERY